MIATLLWVLFALGLVYLPAYGLIAPAVAWTTAVVVAVLSIASSRDLP